MLSLLGVALSHGLLTKSKTFLRFLLTALIRPSRDGVSSVITHPLQPNQSPAPIMPIPAEAHAVPPAGHHFLVNDSSRHSSLACSLLSLSGDENAVFLPHGVGDRSRQQSRVRARTSRSRGAQPGGAHGWAAHMEHARRRMPFPLPPDHGDREDTGKETGSECTERGGTHVKGNGGESHAGEMRASLHALVFVPDSYTDEMGRAKGCVWGCTPTGETERSLRRVACGGERVGCARRFACPFLRPRPATDNRQMVERRVVCARG
jgi:hypothetical protein